MRAADGRMETGRAVGWMAHDNRGRNPMERRKFMIGLGSAAAGSTALVGSSAFSGVISERTASVEIAHDRDAYLGLQEVPDSPNESYVDYERGHLRIRMNPDNPNRTGNGEAQGPNNGLGVNSDSFTWFNDLFRISNQGKQEIKVYLFKVGENPERVVFYESGDACHGTTIGTGESVDVGMATYTHGLSDEDSLLDKLLIVALGTEEYTDRDTAENQLTGEEAEEAVHNDEYHDEMSI